MADIFSDLEGIYEMLGKEIDWCEEHFFEFSESEQYKFGFIAGLKQAQNLLIALEIEIIKGDNEWIKSKS